jgi:NAD(P)H-dependent FMN reductase
LQVVALVGSNRKDSFNKKLTQFIQQRYAQKFTLEILPIDQFPMYNQDDELNPPRVIVESRKKTIESDGVLIATPEYNHSISPVLKNAIDWFSRGEPALINKPTMIVGASMGVLGTVRAQMHLRDILNSPGVSALTLPGNEVFIGEVQNKIDEQGRLTDQPTIDFLDQVVEAFVEWVNKVK